MCLRKEVYSGKLILYGEENKITLIEAGSYASLLNQLKRFKEAKSLLRRTLPVARRCLGENDETTLRMRALHEAYTGPASYARRSPRGRGRRSRRRSGSRGACWEAHSRSPPRLRRMGGRPRTRCASQRGAVNRVGDKTA